MQSSSRTVAVIGATGNIGSAVTKQFARMGYSVIAMARRLDRLQALDRDTAGLGPCIRTLSIDVCDEASTRECFASLAQMSAEIGGVVYAAGLPPDVDISLAQYPIADFRLAFEVYVTGFLAVFQQVVARLNPGGHLLVLSSAITRLSSDRLPGFHAGHYAACKGALDYLIIWARREAHKSGLLLSRLAPGAVDCEYHRSAPPNFRAPALLPMSAVVERITFAIDQRIEIDEQMVAANPEPNS